MADSASDIQDWALVVEGDHRAFERIFDRHSDLVYRFVRRRTADTQLAEDLTAQVFLEAWRQRARVEPSQGSMRPWLLGVASNLVRRHWRTWGRRGRALRRLPLPATQDDIADSVAAGIDAQRRLTETRHRIESLPAKQAEVLLLWAWEQLDYSEIATVLGVPVGTVRSRLSRARASLRDGTPSADRASTGRMDGVSLPSAVEKERRAR